MIYKDKAGKLRIFALILFVAYLTFLGYFLFFADSMGRSVVTQDYHYNFIPFKEILRFWNYRHRLSAESVFLNLAGNIIAFIPFGIFLPMLFRQCQKALYGIVCSMLFSMAIELAQLFGRVGSCDVDDMILNTVGGTIGVILYLIGRGIWRKGHEKKK